MWRTWFKRFGARVVMTMDFDGEVRFRFAKFTKGGVIVSKITGKVLLPLDGSGAAYIRKWIEL